MTDQYVPIYNGDPLYFWSIRDPTQNIIQLLCQTEDSYTQIVSITYRNNI
jgi:hypothetical protein